MRSINVKTEYSLLKSMIKIKDLVKFALDNNLKSLIICDDNLYGASEFYFECIKNKIKPIIGLEIEIDNEPILLYAKNNQGYLNLIKISLDNNNINNYNSDITIVSNTKYNSLFETSYKLEDLNTKPVYYLSTEDKVYYPYLEAIKDGKKIEDIKNKKEDYSYKIDKETIIDSYSFSIVKQDNLIPKFSQDDNKLLTKLLMDSLRNMFGSKAPLLYVNRLKYEVGIIKDMGFSNYFLIVADYVKYAKDNNIMVGPGRGSAAGSLVSYLLGITTIDPVSNNLLFERFLNPERISMPDIDIDFEDTRRDEVINYVKDKYGINNVGNIITFGSLTSKQVIKDVARVKSVNTKLVDKTTSLLDNVSLKDNLAKKELRLLLEENPVMKDVFKIALKLEGLKRHTSTHAAGIVISSKPLDEVLPILKLDNNNVVGYTMNYLENIGLLKMDFLGIKNLTLIVNILSDLNKTVDLDKISYEDPKTLSLFKKGDTLGIFQFESSGMMSFLSKLKPDSFDDIVAAIALYRPGPMDNIDLYIRRKNKEPFNYISDSLESILKSTYGIIIYQEQIMEIATKMANYTLGRADILRKAISKKNLNLINSERESFVKGSINNGYSSEISNSIYDLIVKFASYGFNKAHAVSYAKVAYQMAYLKAHYPTYFYANILTSTIGDINKTKEYINECRSKNILILKPNINESTNKYQVVNGNILYPLSNINNIGKMTINEILTNRKEGLFKDIFDFVKRVNISKKALEYGIYASLFSSFNNKKTLLESIDLIDNYKELVRTLDESFVDIPVIKEQEEYQQKELNKQELLAFSFYLSDHPTLEYNSRYKNIIKATNINKYFDKVVELVLLVETLKEIQTKKGDKMAFLTATDNLGSCELVMFPKVYTEYKNINNNDIIYVRAKVEKRFDKYQLIVQKLLILS